MFVTITTLYVILSKQALPKYYCYCLHVIVCSFIFDKDEDDVDGKMRMVKNVIEAILEWPERASETEMRDERALKCLFVTSYF